MTWRECDDTAIHPLSEARTTRGQKRDRETVNCVALKASQEKRQREVCFASIQRLPNGSVVWESACTV